MVEFDLGRLFDLGWFEKGLVVGLSLCRVSCHRVVRVLEDGAGLVRTG